MASTKAEKQTNSGYILTAKGGTEVISALPGLIHVTAAPTAKLHLYHQGAPSISCRPITQWLGRAGQKVVPSWEILKKIWKRRQHIVVQIQNYCYIFRKTKNKWRTSSFLNLTTRPISAKHIDISWNHRQGRHCRGMTISAQILAALGKHLRYCSACKIGKVLPWESYCSCAPRVTWR